MKYYLGEIAKIVKGELNGNPNLLVTGVSTDSRKIRRNDIFVAIKGERFNGENFVEQAISNGATGAIVSKDFREKIQNVIKVENTIEALGSLAAHYRSQFEKLKVIGITGSTGKTTTKEMIFYAIRRNFNVVKNVKSYNNFIGVPLTIFSVKPETEVLISEIGTNHPGEIDKLVSIVRPQIAIVTSIGPSHLEFFGTVKSVAIEKADILKYLPENGIAILNKDMPFFDEILKMYPVKKLITVSTRDKKGADYYAEINYMDFKRNEVTINGKFKLILHPGGMGTVYGALFSIAVANIFEIPVNDTLTGLSKFHGVHMRKEILEFGKYRILNDAYNANPDSMRDFLLTLKPYRDEVILILGDMFELGDYAEFYHRKTGRLIKELGFKRLFTIGRMARFISLEAGNISLNLHLESIEDIVEELRKFSSENLFIALKASRAMQLERIIEKLRRQ